MLTNLMKDRRGIALISTYVASLMILVISASAFEKAFFEWRAVQRELGRLRAFAAAEAGVQSALAQISVNAYTGFINTTPINVANFQSVTGVTVGNYAAVLNYPNQADWVIVQATGTADGDTRTLEGRVFLDSNLSKYLVFANTATFSSGDNAQYGEPDNTDADGDGNPDYPEFVPANADDRAALYFTGGWNLSGTNVQLYGDANAQTSISGSSSSEVHGDTYAGGFVINGAGQVTNSGVSGGLLVGDGYSDDIDRNGDGFLNNTDYPDYHDLTATGDGDSHKTETLTQIDNNFYKNNNNIPVFGGATAKNRYIAFQANGNTTQVVEYNNSAYSKQIATYNLPANAIVYVNGDVYVKGQVEGRLSVVSSDDIYFQDNVSYTANQKKADSSHSTAFMAKNKLYFTANNLEVSGILYSENSSNSSACFDADYNTAGQYDPASKQNLHLYGNRIMKGGTNLSNYDSRVYGYDGNLKYFRPPGIPVVPSLRTVREA